MNCHLTEDAIAVQVIGDNFYGLIISNKTKAIYERDIDASLVNNQPFWQHSGKQETQQKRIKRKYDYTKRK